MKRGLTAMLTAVALVISMSAIAGKIRVIDMQTVLKQSSQVKQIRQELKDKFSGKRDELQKAQSKLHKLQKQYKKNKSVMKDSKKQDLEDKISKQRQQVQSLQMNFQRSYMKEQNKRLTKFIEKVKDKVQEIAKKEGYELVVEKNSVAYVKDGMDITQKVMSAMNN